MGTVDAQQDFLEIPLLKTVLEPFSGSDPSTSVLGRIWTRTDLSTLKVWLGAAKTLITDDDARLTNSRPPNGTAGGDLTGSYPNPTIGNQKVVLTNIALSLIQSGLSSGSAGTAAAALRALGTTSNDAMAGDRRINTMNSPNGALDMNGWDITGLPASPSGTSAAASKGYVDGLLSGLSGGKWTARVRLTASPGTWTAGTFTGVGTTLDGVAMSTDQLVLVDMSTNQERNGLFRWIPAGSGSLIRADGMNTWAEVPGTIVVIEKGTNADTAYLSVADLGGTLDTTPITFIVFGQVTVYTAGNGLSGSTTFDVNVDSSSIEIVSDILRVKAGGITNAMLAGSIDLTNKVTGILPIANGGTGGSTAVSARSALGVPGIYVFNSPALTAGVWTTLTHSAGVPCHDAVFKSGSPLQYAIVDWRQKSGSTNSAIEIKVDVTGGRAASYYQVSLVCY